MVGQLFSQPPKKVIASAVLRRIRPLPHNREETQLPNLVQPSLCTSSFSSPLSNPHGFGGGCAAPTSLSLRRVSRGCHLSGGARALLTQGLQMWFTPHCLQSRSTSSGTYSPFNDNQGNQKMALDEELEYWDDALFSDDLSQRILKASSRKRQKASAALGEHLAPSSSPTASGGPASETSRESSRIAVTRPRQRKRTGAASPRVSSSQQHQPPATSQSPSFLIFNVFTNRQTRSTTASVRSLEMIGFIPDETTRTLVLRHPERLLEYARKLQNKEIAPPRSWTSFLHKQLTGRLMTMDLPSGGDEDTAKCEAAVKQVQDLIDMMYALARSRVAHGRTGVVSNVVTSTSTASSEVPSALSTNAAEPLSEDASLVLTRDMLTDEQQRVVDLACTGHHLYIGGGAGSGKTTMLRCLKHVLQKELHLAVATTAVTGIAAVNIQGTTLHHRFGITRDYNFVKKKELTKYDVLIIDEVSMIPLQLFAVLDEALRKANGVSLPFGGVQLILCGDFMQLSTISDMPIVGSALFRQNFVMVKLHELIRQSAVSLFAKQLAEMRRGRAPHDLADTVSFLPTGTFVENAINLLPTNAEVVEANEKQLAKLNGDELVFPPLLLPPTLKGQWSDCYVITVPSDVGKYCDKALLSAIEHHLFRAPCIATLMMLTNTLSNAPLSLQNNGTRTIPASPSLRAICMYPLFDDAYALRVQFPSSLEPHEIEIIRRQLSTLNEALASVNGGVHRIQDILQSADGLHTQKDERALEHYAKTSPVGAPLRLKLGCRVLVRSNLSSTIVNGSVGTVVGYRPCSPDSVSHYLLHSNRDVFLGAYATFMKFEHSNSMPMLPVVDFGNGVVETIPPCSFDVGGMADTNHYSASLLAIPLTLAYAFTVHKVQGLTLVGRVHLELSKMWPCDHLLYVAMSRVKDPDQLSVSGYSEKLIQVAAECLVFDESLPHVEHVQVPALAMPATWKQFPGKRRAAIAERASRRQQRSRVEQQKMIADPAQALRIVA